MLNELLGLRNAVIQRRRSKPKRTVRLLRSNRQFKLCDGDVSVRCLTPGDGCTVEYQQKLTESLGVFERATRSGVLDDIRFSINHNLASAAMLIEYKETRVLLLSDAEVPLWRDWEQECQDCDQLEVGPVQAVKVAHHGSPNGYYRPLYDSILADGPPVFVVTPFTRNRSPLPTAKGLAMLCEHSPTLLCTNRMASEKSSGLHWKAPDQEDAPVALPYSWAIAIAQDRRLLRLLAPPMNPELPGTDPPEVPKEWLMDCARDQRLESLLHPNFSSRFASRRPMSSVFEEHLVSLYFNEHGEEITEARRIGRLCGTLASEVRAPAHADPLAVS